MHDYKNIHTMQRLKVDKRQCYLGGGINVRKAWWDDVEQQAHYSRQETEEACSKLGIDLGNYQGDGKDVLNTKSSGGWDLNNTHPIVAILQRSTGCEEGEETRIGDCHQVVMDEGERKLMPQAEWITYAAYMDVLCLHNYYDFTDVCATDGSRKVDAAEVDGKQRCIKKLAWGYFCNLRRARTGRMMGCLEILDAELFAIYFYLKGECQENNERKAALILSDCEAAIKILDSCRNLDKQHLLDVDRAELVHAILSTECKWDIVVYYWIPSHKGITWNAYADAVAKRGIEDRESEVPLTTISELDNDGLPLSTMIWTEETDEGRNKIDKKRYKAVCKKMREVVVEKLVKASKETLLDRPYMETRRDRTGAILHQIAVKIRKSLSCWDRHWRLGDESQIKPMWSNT